MDGVRGSSGARFADPQKFFLQSYFTIQPSYNAINVIDEIYNAELEYAYGVVFLYVFD